MCHSLCVCISTNSSETASLIFMKYFVYCVCFCVFVLLVHILKSEIIYMANQRMFGQLVF